MFAAAVSTALVASYLDVEQLAPDPVVPRGILIDFSGPPVGGVPFHVTWFEITFARTSHRFEDCSVGNSYHPHSSQVSLWAECLRL